MCKTEEIPLKWKNKCRIIHTPTYLTTHFKTQKSNMWHFWFIIHTFYQSFTEWVIALSQQTTQWLEILQRMCLHTNPKIQHRALVIIYNMLDSDNSELGKKLIESEMLEILSVIGKAEDNPKRQEGIDVSRMCLVKAMELGLIKPFSSPS